MSNTATQHPYPFPPNAPFPPQAQFPYGFPGMEEDDKRGCGPITIIASLFMLMMMCLALAVAAYFIFGRSSASPDVPGPGPRPVAALVAELESVMSGVDGYEGHSLYLSKVCDGVAGRLEDHFRDADPVTFDTRQEAVSLVGNVGEFAVMVKGVNNYRGLGEVIESELLEALGEDGEVKPGDLSKSDQEAVVEMFRRLSGAFREVSGA